MKVVTYQGDQVQTQVAAQPTASGNVPAAAFGGPITAGLQNVAQAAAQMNQRIGITEAESALVEFEREKNALLFNPDSGYFNTQGRNAYDGAEPTTKALTDLKKKYSDTLGQTAKPMFDKTADNHIMSAQRDVSRHASQGLKAWEVSTLEAQVENSIENASLYWKDSQAMKVQNILGRQAIIDAATMQGLSSESINEKLQTFDSSFARAAVEAATATSAAQGQALLESMGKSLEGDDKTKLTNMIGQKLLSEKTKADAQYSVIKGNELADRYDDRQQILDEADKIKDVELRDKVISQAYHRLSQKKQAESETRATAFEAAETHLLDAGGTAESFKAENPDGWLALSPRQKKRIEAGELTATNWQAFSGLMTLPKDQLSKIDPNDHFDELAPAERSKLITAVRAAKGVGTDAVDAQIGRSRASQTTAVVGQIFGVRTQKNANNETRNQQVESFYAMLNDEVSFREKEKGSKLTSDEYTNVLNGFSRKTVVEGKIFDSTFTLKDVPTENINELTNFLRSKKIPVTSDNLVKAYQQASK